MKRILHSFFLVTVLFYNSLTFAQPSGFAWRLQANGNYGTAYVLTNNSPTNGYLSTTVVAASTQNGYLVEWDGYWNKWYNTSTSKNTTGTLTWGGGSYAGPDSVLSGGFIAGKSYTLQINGLSYSNRQGVVMETDNAPRAFHATASTAVSTPTSVCNGTAVTINVTLAGAKSAQERVFVRYAINGNFASSKVVEATGTGSNWTTATATIPAVDNVAGTTLNYYAYTTTVAATNSSDHDLITLKYGNNGGSNYSYFVSAYPTAGITNNTGATILTCAQSSISVTATGGSSYSWDNGLGAGATKSITSAGTYIATATNAGGCSSTAQIVVTQNIATPTVTTENVSGCSESPIALIGMPSGGTFSQPNPYNGSTATYTYTYTNPANGCSATSTAATITVTPIQTPIVALTSSDNDNMFAYGTPVTFTATPSNLGGGSAVYNFKVDGVSVQNGASNTFSSNTIADGQTVSVSMVVSSGACLTTNTDTSTTITNTVTGAVILNFLYAQNYCGATVDTINPTFYCTSPSVGASTLSYRFVITNTVTGLSQTVNRVVPNANLLLTALAAYNTLYTVKVAAVVDGVLQPYSDLCSVTTPVLALNKVVSTQCGSTLAALNSTINVGTITGAQNYRFRVSLASNAGVSEEVVSAFPSFRLTSLTTIPLNYGNTYNVEVQSDVINNGVAATTPYGDVCFITTPSVASISATPNLCGTTLPEINSRIYVNSVPGAIQYTYRVALATAPGVNYDFSTPFTNFRLTSVPGLPLIFGTTYNVSVSVRVNVGGINIDSGFGATACQYSTPAGPTTQIQTAQCGGVSFYQVPANNTSIVADFVSGASYRFKLENLSLTVPYSQTISRPVNNFTLSMFTGLTAGTIYTVSVALDFYGTGDYGKGCTIRTPEAVGMVTRVIDTPFSAIAYPNPFSTSFTLAVSTKSSSSISVKVYDMLGRLVEEHTLKVTELETITIGDKYPVGVYNVIVTQESDVSTVRLIKR